MDAKPSLLSHFKQSPTQTLCCTKASDIPNNSSWQAIWYSLKFTLLLIYVKASERDDNKTPSLLGAAIAYTADIHLILLKQCAYQYLLKASNSKAFSDQLPFITNSSERILMQEVFSTKTTT